MIFIISRKGFFFCPARYQAETIVKTPFIILIERQNTEQFRAFQNQSLNDPILKLNIDVKE
ncbi:CLUMA_CG016617, isoform A [Clunio marinus]|uniref:CLUMA_CG016617, isoform A n=1 Tax=Clunio marinus TaxID=568069 RepID=A0A1J1ITX8_9DIPT|nr:CLUMA_CG016617, isoform A [Clunio marinus]